MSLLVKATDDFDSYEHEAALDENGWNSILNGTLQAYDSGPGMGFNNSAASARGNIKTVPSGWAEWGKDQFSQITVVDSTGDGTPGVCVRSDGSDSCYVAFVVSGAGIELGKFVSGSYTQINVTGSGEISDADELRLEVEGGSLEVFVNDSSVLSDTDSDISDGSPGIYSQATTTNTDGDDWQAGRISHLRGDIVRPTMAGRHVRRRPPSGRVARNNRRV